jgi:putative tryptophan/tyrosine transport system substrate-binding protein
MKRATVPSILIAVVLLAVGVLAEAQQPKKVPRVGFLATVSPSTISDRVEAFRQGLRELGYVEGKNIVIEWRYEEGKADRQPPPGLAAELVRLKVDVIVTAGPLVTRAAKEATSTIPIVMGQDTDPVGNGFVASLARPGGNITGLATFAPEISGKQLELLKETVPKLTRVAVLGNASRPGSPQALREINVAADGFGVKVQYLEVREPKDIETAFRVAGKGRAEAVLVLGGPRAQFSPNTNCRPRGKEPAPGDIRKGRIYGRWWPHVLRREHYRNVPTRRRLCGQDFEGREAR